MDGSGIKSALARLRQQGTANQEPTTLESINTLCNEVDLAVTNNDNAGAKEVLKQIRSILESALQTDLSLEEIANILNTLAKHELINLDLGRTLALHFQELLIRYADRVTVGKELFMILKSGQRIALISANEEGTRLAMPARRNASTSATLIGILSSRPVILARAPALMNLKIISFYIGDSEA